MVRKHVFAMAVLLLAPAQAFAADKPSQEERKKEDRDRLRVGPVVSLGFPRPFALEGLLEIEKVVGLGVEYSFMPKTTVADVTTRFDAFALDANWYPFKGGFFIGMRAGRQWLSGSATLRVQNVGAFTESAQAATWFVNPRIGYLYTFSSGITLGVDAGVQLPIGATYERSGPATSAGLAQGTAVDNTLRQVANTLGNEVTPTVDLFRIGFLF
ncbi:MAG: hypothetical protein U0270_18895 [Labilithrix sp.]